MRHTRSILARFTTSAMALVALAQFGPAHSAPADVFSIPAPVIGSDPPKATELKDGDASVSSQTGALQYSYPIQVPPGRRGMSPHLALSYSSQAPIYGGIAAGWSLSIPEIREDTAQGRLRTHSPEVEATQSDPKADDRFVSSLAGGRLLVPVDEPKASTVYKTYRAQNDTSFARYERMSASSTARWRVYTTDGTVMLFGESARTLGCVVDDGYAPLTTVVDSFGNEIRYEYGSAFANECRLNKISWGWNPNAGLADFASVKFNYVQGTTTCGGVEAGSARSYRTGRLIVAGASKLTSIVATAYPPGVPSAPVHTRTIMLTYSPNDEGVYGCAIGHAPFRQIDSLQESAYGTDSPPVTLPPVTFEYGTAALNLVAPQQGFASWSDVPNTNLAWGYRYNDDRWPTVEAMLLDVDGDGLLDRVTNASDPGHDQGSCQAQWQRNLGPLPNTSTPHFAPSQPLVTLPRLKWNGTNTTSPPSGASLAGTVAPYLENCSLNGQVTAYRNSNSGSLCHDSGGHTCQSGTDPNNPGPFCLPAGTECPNGTNTPGTYHTYLAYRWMDMDGDGLPDLVTAVHGDINRYDIDQGNMVGFPAENTYTWPTCPAVERCKDIDTTCAASKRTCPVGQLCTVDWTSSSSLRTCIDGATQAGCSSLMQTESLAMSPGPGGGLPPTFLKRTPYTRCQGLYPWFIYKNQGHGTFATTPTIKYQPVPLESDAGDSAILSRGISAQRHGVMDFDGDGIPDAVALARGSNNTGYLYNVWLGDGTGGFGPKRYIFPTRNGPLNRISGFATTWSASSSSSEGLLDINGDGLPDHWLTPNTQTLANANIAFHDGTQHRLIGQASPTPTGETETPTSPPVKPGNDSVGDAHCENDHCGPILYGSSSTTNRVLDLDADGRVDVATDLAGTPHVFYNVGGQFMVGVGFAGDTTGAQHEIHADGGTGLPLTWQLASDMVDLDGDGIPESAYFQNGNLTRAQHVYTTPPRLMRKITNGRGADTTIAYSTMHAEDTVVQDPSNGKSSPHNQWVVKSLTTVEHVPTDVSSTTSYFYKNPHFGPDDEGHYAFRGFDEVTTTNPSGSKLVQRYGYAPDWSGRLVTSIVISAEAVSSPTSIDKTTWEARQLFNGAVTTYHPTLSEHFTCDVGQTESTCTATAAAGYTRTTTTLTALASTTQPGTALVWQPTSSLLQGGTTAADGDRETISTFGFKADVVGDATAYRLRSLTTTRNYRLAGTMTMFAKGATTWDTDFLVPLTSETWFDSDDTHRAIARSVYDMTTGNVIQRFKPKQNAANTTSTTLTYDSRKLFATTEVNELGHQLDHVFEYGTGANLETDGPNARSCTSNCPSGAQYPIKEQHKIRIDGLGRPIEKWDTTSDDGAIYTLYQREATSYVDTYNGTTPTSVTHQTRFDTTGSLWKQEKSELDGHGRPIRQIVFAQGSAPADQITSYVYRKVSR